MPAVLPMCGRAKRYSGALPVVEVQDAWPTDCGTRNFGLSHCRNTGCETSAWPKADFAPRQDPQTEASDQRSERVPNRKSGLIPADRIAAEKC